jgi:pilus assembly protein CpaB
MRHFARRRTPASHPKEGRMNYTLRNLVIAAVLMLLGIVLVTSFIRQERRDLSRGKQEITVYIAAKDIPAGTPADELESGGFVETKDVLREDAPPQALGKLSALKDRVSNETIYQGETVNTTSFDVSTGLKPTAQVKGNERLVSLPILASNDVAGLIRPGDHVDLLATMPVQGGGSQALRLTVLARDVEVIETPNSLVPEGTEAAAEAPDADGDRRLYVFKATDSEIANILYGQSAADDHGITMQLRPSSGDTDSKINPLTDPQAVT